MSGLNKYRDVGEAGCEVRRTTLREDLEMQLSQANSEVARLTELLDLLNQNPDTNRILELLGRR